ncbi:MAG: hypothetical protein HFF51_09360 [Lawsonibacter sp.]|nr:hypothetical protein [Lawsonibacter sp.]
MLTQFDPCSKQLLPENWYLEFTPAQITIHSLKTGRQVREPSLVAVGASQPNQLLAVGKDALQYQNNPEAVVFSPFRQGKIAQYPAAQALLKALLKQAGCGAVLIPKPVMCIHTQEHTSKVEEVALAEAAIQCGARKVFLYTESLPAMLDLARSRRDLQSAVLIHIESQD